MQAGMVLCKLSGQICLTAYCHNGSMHALQNAHFVFNFHKGEVTTSVTLISTRHL